MEILALEIWGFGKHVERRFDFKPTGLHFFWGPNEAGKTTFVRAFFRMLFGYKRGEKKNREGSRPWKKGASFGGKLVFRREKDTITLERNFGKHLIKGLRRNGTTKEELLWDNHGHPTLQAQEEQNSSLLQYLGISDPELFLRTAMVSQMAIGPYIEGGLSSFLSRGFFSLLSGGEVNYREALEKIREEYYSLTSEPLKGERHFKRVPGELDSLEEERNLKRERLENLQKAYEKLASEELNQETLEEDLQKIEEEIRELQKEVENLQAFLGLRKRLGTLRERRKQVSALLEEKKERRRKVDALEEQILRECKIFINSPGNLEENLEKLQDLERREEALREDLDRRICSYRNSGLFIKGVIPFCILVAGGGSFFLPGLWKGLALFFSLLIGGMGLFLSRRKKKLLTLMEENFQVALGLPVGRDLKGLWEGLQGDLLALREKLKDFLPGEKQGAGVLEKFRQYSRMVMEKETLILSLSHLEDFQEEWEDLQGQIYHTEKEEGELLKFLPFLNSLEGEAPGDRVQLMEKFYGEKKRTLEDFRKKRDQKEREFLLSRARNTILRESLGGNPQDLQYQIEELEERGYPLTLQKEALSVAWEVLKEESHHFAQEASPQMIQKMEELAKEISGGRIGDVKVHQGELQVSLPEKKGLSTGALSQGTSDILYLALRLALIDFLYPHQKFPLVFDDSFIHLDEDRQAQAFQVLSELAKDRQIFYLTLTPRWKKYGVKTVTL